MVEIKRIYDSYELTDYYRVLVDRVWPRGVSKQKASLDLWAKEIAPSNELRKWFNHEDDKWDEFKKKYLKELHENSAATDFVQEINQHSKVVLLYSAKNELHNQAVVLQEYLKNVEN